MQPSLAQRSGSFFNCFAPTACDSHAQLRGPPSESFLYGVGQRIRSARDAGALYDAWAQEYRPVYAIPSTLGTYAL
ncbi:hypothetical protein EV363DRAFT_1180575 [Boletus edulis]|nr:hypothetical protein EV363DRAFT_1180575 [Boletus edulis]